MPDAIGLDLGTTNSLCAIFVDGKPKLIPNSHGRFLTPSMVGVLQSGEIVVGETAKELQITHPKRVASRFKRSMGTNHSFALADRSFTPQELSSLILKSLVADAESHLNRPVKEAVITVPAYFNDAQRKATHLAGELAGLRVRRIINEPTAAALVYGFHQRDVEKHLCVIDLGGGTFDVTIMEIFEGTMEILSTAGESMLGGEDFTDRIVAEILLGQGKQLESEELVNAAVVSRLRAECESAKRQLVDQRQSEIRMPNDSGEIPPNASVLKIDDETFRKWCQPLMSRIALPIERALRDADCSPDSMDDVVLVGGATRMPVLVDFVRDFFGRPIDAKYNPDEVVALGASIQAALIEQDQGVDDLVMTDVCPFTLGIAVVKDIGGRIHDGYFTPVLHRNTTIPVSREQVFCTVSPNQREVVIRIYQGDARKVTNNVGLGELTVKDIPSGPAGTPINVRFTYDLNGILEVEAYTNGGQKHRIVLTNQVQGLSPQEVDAAVDRLQNLKFYPREDLRYQHLARYCERMMGEIHPQHRAQLDQVLDAFESALALGDRNVCESCREALLITLSSLGIPYDEEE